MKQVALDCSLTMSWCFQDEKCPQGEAALDFLVKENHQGIVPSLWKLEVVNVLHIAEKRKRLTTANALLFMDFLLELPLVVEEAPHDLKDLFLLSHTYDLSAYDAAYLDLAIREHAPLATLDKKLQRVAQEVGISLFLH